MHRTTRAAEYLRRRILTAVVLTLTLSVPVLADNDKIAVKIMTRNMDEGTDLLFLLAATDATSFVSAMAATYAEINASNIPLRASRLADEIAAEQPDLIGLQEADLWRTGALNGAVATTVLYDQLQLLMAELANRNLHYSIAAVQSLGDAQAPDFADGISLRITDRNALLVRSDLPPGQLDVLSVQAQRYNAVFSLTNAVLGTLSTPCGFIAADVKIRGTRFKFATTHLQALSPDPATTTIQVEQANELISAFNSDMGSVILAGDFNANADMGPDHSATTTNLVAAGFIDAWRAAHPSELGSTWPLYLEDQFAGIPVTPFERIDLIFGRSALILGAEQTGLTPIYASDHVGVVATLLAEK